MRVIFLVRGSMLLCDLELVDHMFTVKALKLNINFVEDVIR